MSNIAIQGAATGTGVFTLASPATNTDRTLTLPDEAGTVLTSGTPVLAQKGVPAFSAYQSSSQSVSTTTWTKVQLQTEEFDTNTCFDSTTNYRFTPTSAGYYQVSGSVRVGAVRTTIQVNIYKNGAAFKDIGTDVATYSAQANGSALIYFNGSTDYVELYCFLGAGQGLTASATSTYFQASMVRAA